MFCIKCVTGYKSLWRHKNVMIFLKITFLLLKKAKFVQTFRQFTAN